MTTSDPRSEHPLGEWVLVTNDDGIDSPALRPLLRRLAPLAPVVAVVPLREYSWTSKTLSRFAQPVLEKRASPAPGTELYSLDGSPADCANVGVHNVFRNAPRLVVSGVNVGSNAGLSFLLSSGTVGAAVEGMLAGVASVALSAQLRPEDYQRWRDERTPGADGLWERAAEVGAQIVAEVLAGGLPAGCDVLSANMPPDVSADTPRVMVAVARTRYGAFFRPIGDGAFEHHYSGLHRVGEGGEDDIAALSDGRVALTPLRFDLDAPVSDGDRQRFEQE